MRCDKIIHMSDGGEIKIRYAKEDVTRGTYRDWLHSHDFYEICIIISGDMLHIVNGRTYVLKRGDVFFCRENELHYAKPNSESTYERYAFWIPANIFDGIELGREQTLGFMMNESLIDTNCISIRPEKTETLFSMLADMRPIIEGVEKRDNILLYAKLCAVLNFINHEATAHTLHITADADIPPLVQKILRYIGDNSAATATTEEVAEHFYMNKDYIARYFKKYTGLSIHDYIVFSKINEGKRMLRNKMSVTEVAYACGFNNISYFIRVFRAQIGMTPDEYKRAQL